MNYQSDLLINFTILTKAILYCCRYLTLGLGLFPLNWDTSMRHSLPQNNSVRVLTACGLATK